MNYEIDKLVDLKNKLESKTFVFSKKFYEAIYRQTKELAELVFEIEKIYEKCEEMEK